jgi:transcription initiation factor IIE alpha subunit
MKKIIILAVAFLVSLPVLFAQEKAGKQDTTQHAVYYTCSMHADVIMNKPGKCPKCGMDLNLSAKEDLKSKITKTYTCPVHLSATSHNPGKCPICGKKLNLSSKEQMKAEVGKVYTCPMHPEVALDKDGKCPKCGIALVEKKQQ